MGRLTALVIFIILITSNPFVFTEIIKEQNILDTAGVHIVQFYKTGCKRVKDFIPVPYCLTVITCQQVIPDENIKDELNNRWYHFNVPDVLCTEGHIEDSTLIVTAKDQTYKCISGLDNDECTLGTNNCHSDAVCTNTVGSFTCACSVGYTGDGVTCTDIDECKHGIDSCHANAACSNTPGSFTCKCNFGYTGVGISCTDNDECTLGTNNCHADADCTNTVGSFTCACSVGYTGDGLTCTDNDECKLGTDNCHNSATCANTAGNFTCTCSAGYTGDGVTCTGLPVAQQGGLWLLVSSSTSSKFWKVNLHDSTVEEYTNIKTGKVLALAYVPALRRVLISQANKLQSVSLDGKSVDLRWGDPASDIVVDNDKQLVFCSISFDRNIYRFTTEGQFFEKITRFKRTGEVSSLAIDTKNQRVFLANNVNIVIINYQGKEHNVILSGKLQNTRLTFDSDENALYYTIFTRIYMLPVSYKNLPSSHTRKEKVTLPFFPKLIVYYDNRIYVAESNYETGGQIRILNTNSFQLKTKQLNFKRQHPSLTFCLINQS